MASVIDTYARAFLAYIERRRGELQKEHDAAMKAAAEDFPKRLAAHVAEVLGIKADRVSVRLSYFNPDDGDRSRPGAYKVTVGKLRIEGIGENLSEISADTARLRDKAKTAADDRARHCAHDGLKTSRQFAGRMRLLHGEKLTTARLEALAAEWIAGKACGC